MLTTDEYEAERERFERQLLLIEEKRKSLGNTERLLEPLRQSLLFATEAKCSFANGDDATRRRVIVTVSSNLSLREKKLHVVAKEPFEHYRKFKQFPLEQNIVEDVGTILQKEKGYVYIPSFTASLA
ncbi:MAG TPA: hypothetical protein DCY48_02135 [Candidatus Magasanikbacteria bacterium]|nr:MAG: hypothetical protein A3I74_01045 [Candidatus Magasanikbacteria bacterium RIFCSPLOWO2_02_FULL_47_16]OGH79969.1 MAG: hypothetical protein A3C10_02180 [Candidatus Magasanikbacteria bacterium RIFCSPHIGHO2_02_FULL_48_18]OGH82981.1 MAG: hypothetical protein A3G08_03665 [Candidatus Magasanikbacteria bacterium RIFCSPLOWO2_12_FULL_47_9b]HAZ28555.1 hypothetical protein [Candidatus Magasanikbacteria bacterium]